ncbi:MAG: glucoamylase family protein [bacterium]
MILPAKSGAELDVPFGINVGGKASLSDERHCRFVADRPYQRGNGAGYRREGRICRVAARNLAEPFRTLREGNVAYHFDLKPGLYRITLAFCEPRRLHPYQRVFNVRFNRYVLLQEFDPAAEHGVKIPALKTFVFRVDNEGLDITATGIVGEPILSFVLIESGLPAGELPAAPHINRVVARDRVCYLEWNPSPTGRVAGYRVFRADSANADFVEIAATGPDRTSFIDRLVKNGRTYIYEVVAVTEQGNYHGASARVTARPHMPNDDQLIEMTTQAAFHYFVKECDPATYLTRDKNIAPYISCAAVGFGLSAMCIGAERGWIDSDDAEMRCFTMIKTLNDREDNKRWGLFFHYLNGDGSRSRVGYQDTVSTIDSALLMWGAIAAGEHFRGRVRDQAALMMSRMNWRAFADEEKKWIRMAWEPDPEKGDDFGKFYSAWDWYSDEAILVTLLAISAPNPEFRLGPEYYYAFNRPRGDYKKIKDIVYTRPGTLFTYTFAHCWLDFRLLGADSHGFDVWENSRKAILANRQYCMDLAKTYRTFGAHSWGLTACSGNKSTYCVAGAPPCGEGPNPGGGTVGLFAAGMSVPFATAESLAALQHYYRYRDAAGYRRLWKDEFEGGYGFIDSYSLDQDFFSDEIHGINHGPMLLLLENFRTGLLWNLVLQNETILAGLRRAGFLIPR